MENIETKGIVMATRLEAMPFIDSGIFDCIEEKPFYIYRHGLFLLIVSGIGKANVAIATTYLITKYKTEAMYNVGASGTTTKNYKLGDILHIDSVLDYDRPTLIESKRRLITPDIIPHYPTTTLATQDKPVVSSEERENVGKFASLVDMEGAAFVQACRIFQVKSYLFKIVTDTPEHTNNNQIVENIKKTRDDMFRFFIAHFLE